MKIYSFIEIGENMIAEVIINRGAKKLNRTFDYNIPKDLEELILVGSKVLVPFGNGEKLAEAFVVGIKEKSAFELKNIAKLEENLTDKQISLAKWMAKRYFCNISDCIKLMLTPGTRNKNKEKRIQDKTINCVYLKKDIEEIEFEIETGKIKSEKQKRLLNFVKDNEGTTVPEIEMFTDCARGIVNTLVKNGYLEIIEKKVERNPLLGRNCEKTNNLKLTEEQKNAYNRVEEAIDKNEYKQFLLYGVTGSGKTEVYLQLIEKVLKIGKNAIVLVPEISLTPQMLDRFISRFGKSDIAILHSKLSIGERHDEWERIRERKARIVIGARSAIFAPIENIGIIIIDEEHDSSYKSETNPRYNAKEIAKILAKENKAPLLLGSATPDINTFYNATSENEDGNTKTKLLTLTKRANESSLPKVEIIDLKQELANGNRSMLSMELYNSIEENISQKRQTILFLNRRGYSTFIMCRNCGYTVKCPSCNISMTYHSYEKKLKCHYCSYEENLVTTCPECHSDKIRYFGTGTQKLEQEINKQFPNASTIRMDIDTVTKKNSHEEILNKFKNENIDILIGTQMVVKGHHFPNVTLVGVIAADSSLNIDDYRANERTFQILTQVAGRAGRENLPGKVIIQTYNPDNFSIICAQKQNYEMFYETEIALRKQLKYPPFCDIILISFNSLNETNIKNISNEMYKKLLEKLNQEEFKIFRPMPSPIDKIQNRYRWRIIIKGNMTVEANEVLNQTLKEIYSRNIKDIRISIDVNPNNMS
ncbi:MAG: primosomal protein N' [Clostridia bacterium]|nr:primosomal protein N' [Clostridium sp.]